MDRELKLNIDSDKIRKKLRDVDSSLKKTQTAGEKTATKVQNAFKNAAKGIGVASAAASVFLAALVVSSLKSGDALAKMADKIGLSTEALATLNFQTSLFTGAGAGALSEALTKATKRLGEFNATGGGAAARWLEKLNLDTEELARLSPDQLFNKYTESIRGLNSRGEQLAAISALMGDESRQLIGLVDASAESMAAAAAEAEAFGLTLSRVDAAKMEEVNDAWTKVGAAFTGLGNKLTILIAPALIYVMQLFTDSASAADGWVNGIVDAFKSAGDTFGWFVENIDTVGIALMGLSTLAIPSIITGMSALSASVIVGINAIGVAIAANPIGLIIVALTLVTTAAYHFREEIYQTLIKLFEVTLPNSIDAAQVSFLKMKRYVGELMNGILIKINEFGNSLITSAPKWLQEFLGIDGQTFKLGIDIAAVNRQIDELEATITNRINNFVPPDAMFPQQIIETAGGDGSTPTAPGGVTPTATTGPPAPNVAELAARQETIDAQAVILEESLLSEENSLLLSFERRSEMVRNAFGNSIEDTTRRKKILTGLTKEFEAEKTAIARRGEQDRMNMMAANVGHTGSIMTSLSTLMAKEGEKMSTKQKVLAKAGIIASTAAAIMRSHAQVPWPGNWLEAGAIALQGAVQLRAVGAGSGGISSSGASTSTPTTPPAPTPLTAPAVAPVQGETVIMFTGNFTGWNDQVIDDLTAAIAAGIDDRDIRIISPDSRQAQDLAVAG